jgi:putative FmdB family regulatory protein
MPIYEYHCKACGADFEELVFSRSDEAGVKCKSCGSASIVKLLSASAVVSSPPAFSCPVNPSGGGSCPHAGGCGCR